MKLSIVIPTRERKKYLTQSVKTALAVRSDDVEIVVSDNASQDGTASVLAEISDPRFVYTNTGTRVSMRANFENALKASSGDYVIFIGDDDGILPGQIPMLLNFLKSEQPDSLAWQIIRYRWPDKNRKKSGTMRLSRSSVFGRIEPTDIAKLQDQIARYDMTNHDMIPRIYHGIMSRDYLRKYSTPDGQFFNCSIPDVFTNFLAAFNGGNHLFCQHPFSINGASSASNGESQAKSAQIKDVPDIAAQFISENSTDHNLDVADFGSTLPAAYFLALETARVVSKVSTDKVNYECWFSKLLRKAEDMQPNPRRTLVDALDSYAKSIGKVAEWERAKTQTHEPLGAFQKFQKKLPTVDKLTRARFSCEYEGENTIFTAAQVCDMLIGGDFDAILNGSKSRRAAWSALKKRYRSGIGRP